MAASILGVLLIGGYFASSRGEPAALPAGYLISAVVLAVAFWIPAMRIGSARDVLAGGVRLLAWLLAWTLVWDLATSGLLAERRLFDSWWIVYPSGVLVLGGLLILHGAVVQRAGARRGSP